MAQQNRRRNSPHQPREQEAHLCFQNANRHFDALPSWNVFMCPPFRESKRFYKHRTFGWVGVWFFPMFLAGFAFFLQNFQLRIGTYFYVHKMLQYDLQLRPGHDTHFSHVAPLNLTIGKSPEEVSFASLEDPVVGQMGRYEPVNIALLDALAACFPFFFVVLAVSMDLSRLWTRIMLCFAFLSIGKGFFGWITVVPDSNGWQVCKDRLATGSHTLSGTVADVSWYAEYRTVWELLLMSPTSRLCADMMWSGHTYFVTIFAFGLHECTRIAMRSSSMKQRILAETIVTVAAILQQGVEIYFVLRSRFHYTSDVFMAVLMTYLVYTNTTVAVLANWWGGLSHDELEEIKQGDKNDEHFGEAGCKSVTIEQGKSFTSSEWFDNGLTGNMVSLGCCCCSWNQHWIHTRQDMVNVMDDLEAATRDKSELDPYKLTPEKSYLLRMIMCMVEDFSIHDYRPNADYLAMVVERELSPELSPEMS